MAKILVIEDSSLMKVYLRRCLENQGHTVEDWTPMSAMEVPDKIAALAPDLVITDYLMPGCNGASVARMTQKANPRIPVIVITASRDEEVVSNLGRFGVNQILYKPVEAALLAQTVSAALGEG